MRKLLIVWLAALLPVLAGAQLVLPATWSFSVSKSDVKVGDEVELIFKADIPQDWYMYSNEFKGEGPIKAVFKFDKNATYKLVGGVKAINPVTKEDEFFGEVKIFKKKAEFKQKVKILAANPAIKGTVVEYQICSDISGKCAQFFEEEGDFGKLLKVSGGTNAVIEPVIEEQPTQDTTPKDTTSTQVIDTAKTIAKDTSGYHSTSILEGGSCETKKFVGESGIVETKKEDESLFWFAIVAFLSGLAALLTPCVFPMIPMTVTFFLKGSGSKAKGLRNAILYGVFIILIYTIIGTVFAVVFGAEFANLLATDPIINVIFFVVFVIFAMSFFGMFEIVLPSKFVNRIDKQSDRGGLIGVFFMALTLVLVSFSCTGPIVGTILVEAAKGGVVRPIVGMAGFSLAFALPFTLFAIFPNMLKSLPKSGGWLNSVKVVLGFVELALGLKFLSVADQTQHWHILDRDIYIALWIVIFTLMGIYLLGKLKFSHDSDMPYLGVPRLFMAILTFAFVVYLIPGMWGAPLPGLAGYLPPTTSHSFNLPAIIRGDAGGVVCETPKYEGRLHLPHGLKGYFEYKQAIRCAKEQKKPLFIDFTGHGCVNCRKMEDKVWADPQVLNRLKKDFVVVALYVDDKDVLPESEWVKSKVDGKMKKTIGSVNADIQICYFGNNAQPNYCILDTNEELLAEPRGVSANTPNAKDYDVADFVKFLDDAKSLFNKRMGSTDTN
ncbi:MAG: protein-disulfide reductase DsbD family protein [Bacteroidota bacterium]